MWLNFRSSWAKPALSYAEGSKDEHLIALSHASTLLSMSGFISAVIDVTPLKPALKLLQWELTAKAVNSRILRFLTCSFASAQDRVRNDKRNNRNDKGDSRNDSRKGRMIVISYEDLEARQTLQGIRSPFFGSYVPSYWLDITSVVVSARTETWSVTSLLGNQAAFLQSNQ